MLQHSVARSQALKAAEALIGRPGAFVAGQWLRNDKTTFPVLDPFEGTVVANVVDCGSEVTQQAISAAHEAQTQWQNTTPHARARLLMEWHRLILQNADILAGVITAENGKTLNEARGEVKYAASFIEWFAEEGKRSYGRSIPAPVPHHSLMVSAEPVGVCGLITPWNFPLAMLTRKMGPALAAGCTLVAKPAPETPLSAVALIRLAELAGFPTGVVNLITSSRQTSPSVGQGLCQDNRVRKISFTGSTAVGMKLFEWSAQTVKRLSLELGGNAPFLVLPSSSTEDTEFAINKLMDAKLRNSGQTCIAPNRILVASRDMKEFSKRLAAKLGNIRVGSGFDKSNQMGPLISPAAVDKMKIHMEDAVSKGGQPMGPMRSSGQLVSPLIVSECDAEMLVAHEETFAPLFPLFGYEEIDDAILQANSTNFGLASYVMSKSDPNAAQRVASRIKSGMVGVNAGIISFPQAPFGGVKHSGVGREGGQEGLKEFQDIKYIYQQYQ